MLTLKIGNISDNNLSFDVKNLGKRRAKPKAEESYKKQNSKEINRRKTIEEISERKNWFFEKISKTDKLLVRLTKKKKGEKTQINNIRTKTGSHTTPYKYQKNNNKGKL